MVYFSALDITVQLKDSDTKQALNEYPHPIFDKTNLHDDRPDDDLYERYWREDSATVRANPQGQDPEHNGLRPRIIRNLQYCGEAEAGKRFVIGVYFGTQFPYKDYDVYIRIYVDGQWACGASIERKRFRKQWGHRYTNYAALETKDGWTTSPRYYFAPVEFNDDAVGEDMSGATERSIGSVRVLMWRVELKGSVKTNHTSHLRSVNELSLREKKTKAGQSIRVGAIYRANGGRFKIRPRRKTFVDDGPESVDRNPSDSSLGHPFADARLLYRDRRSLQMQGLIERDPSPDESEPAPIKPEPSQSQLGRHHIVRQDQYRDVDSDEDIEAVWLERPAGPGNEATSPIDVDDIPDRAGDAVNVPIDISDDDGEEEEDDVLWRVEGDRTGFGRANTIVRNRPRNLVDPSAGAPRSANQRPIALEDTSELIDDDFPPPHQVSRPPSESLFVPDDAPVERQEEPMNAINAVRLDLIQEFNVAQLQRYAAPQRNSAVNQQTRGSELRSTARTSEGGRSGTSGSGDVLDRRQQTRDKRSSRNGISIGNPQAEEVLDTIEVDDVDI